MTKITAISLAIALVCLLPGTQALAVTSAGSSQNQPLVKPLAFPHEHSSLKMDPAVRYGRLANGMTYLLQSNKTPPGTAAVYLRISAGSMMEDADQRGLAHFVEHMAFNGTRHIAEGQLKPILERHGFAFGADANAYTNDSETVYTLNAPKSDAETLDTALFILRDIAGDMTLAPAAIDRERGVILGEERLRDTPMSHRELKWFHTVYDGARYADYGTVIGSTYIISHAPPSRIRDFYDTWYRPELATLVVVGDFDVDAMEKKITARFGDWKAHGPAPHVPDWGQTHIANVTNFAYAESGINEEMGVTWVAPPESRDDGVERKREAIQDQILAMLVNRRLQLLALDPKTAYLSAGVGSYGVYKTAQHSYLSVAPKPGQAKAAFEQAYGVLQTFRDQGVTPDEIQMVETILPIMVKNIRDGYATRDNSGIAGSLLSDMDNNSVSQGLDDGLALFDTIKSDLVSADKLDARLKVFYGGTGPILSHSGADLSAFDVNALAADYTAMTAKGAATYAAAARTFWPYGDFGPAVAPASHTVDNDFGYGRYVWPNGVTLNVKPTHFTANSVAIEVDFAGGQVRFDPATKPPIYLANGSFLFEGGLKKLPFNQMGDALLGKTWQGNYALLGDRAVLSGTTVTGDLGTELQVLMAYTTDAAYASDPFERFRSYTPQNLSNLRAYPESVRGYNWAHLLNSADPRFDQTQLEQLDKVSYDDVVGVMRTSLSDSPINITIVGDVDEATAVSEISKTFGTLPKRPDVAPRIAGADVVAFPPAQHDFTLYHEGRADQSISSAVWPADDFYADPKAARGLMILSRIMSQRLFDVLRESQGADYAPSAFANADEVYHHNGLVGVVSTIKPGGDDDFRRALARIVADLKTRPVTADELTRATKPIFDGMDNEVNTNGYWQYAIARVSNDPRARADWLQRRAQLEAVTPKTLMALANTYLRDDTEIFMKVLPDPAKPAP